MQTQKRKELRVRNKCTCHVYGQIHQYRIQIETEEIKLDAQSSKTKLQKIQRWQRVEKQKTLKLKTQVFQLKQPHKKPGFPLTIGRIEHGTLEHPSARRAPYYPICYTCSWHSPPLLVSVATSCLNREGLEPKWLRIGSPKHLSNPKTGIKEIEQLNDILRILRSLFFPLVRPTLTPVVM